MCANPQSNRLNTNAAELHTFYLFEAISLVKTKKNRGVIYRAPGKNQNRDQSVFFNFGVDPLN